MSYRVGLDISGGDLAPREIFKGALEASEELGAAITLIGRKEEIEREAERNKTDLSRFNVIYTTQHIKMSESPALSVRRKKDSSIVKGVHLLKERKIDALVSCGNTGAVVCAATMELGLIKGVERPGIGLAMPTLRDVSLILDVGANIDAKPMHMLQYGAMASAYSKSVLNKENPTVGLLNIGEEESKGPEFVKIVHKLFSVAPFNFIGNVEPKDIFTGKCDCIICDGFIGNIALKVTEGAAEAMGKYLVEVFKQDMLGLVGVMLMKKSLRKFKSKLDYTEYGGAPLLGVDGIVIIGHGRSNAKAVKNAVRVAVNELKQDLNTRIRENVDKVCQDNRVKEILDI